MDTMKELNMNEMEAVTGGKNEGGYDRKPRAKKNCFIYKIQSGDTLTKIANRNDTTVQAIMRVNPELKNPNFIVAGCYIFIPA